MKLDLKKVIKEIKPSLTEENAVKKAVLEFSNKIKKDLVKEKAAVVLGGSIAKGTWLKGNHDIDVFVQFSDEKNISARLSKILNKKFSACDVIHGSRDYYHIQFLNFTFEIVPVVKIKNIYQAKNVTDCSVFHIKWVNKNSNLKMKDDIRLVKQFCKASGVYGAETHIAGFSGYVAEILTIYFGGFEKFVKGIASLEEGIIIDMSKHKKNLDKNKLSPIILIDPVQGDRNAAAALSIEKFEKLKKICSEFLKKPTLDYFSIKRKNLKEILSKFDVVLSIEPLVGKKDVVGTKVLKIFEFLQEKLNYEGFSFVSGDWEFDIGKSYIWFNVKNKEIPQEFTHFGPPVSALEFAESFKEKYKNYNVFISGNKLAVNLKKNIFEVHKFVENLLKDKYVSERARNIKILK